MLRTRKAKKNGTSHTMMTGSSASSSSSLQGLRGLASLHVVVFHCLLYSPLKLVAMGSVQMPLFFLLSGFSLALAYTQTDYVSLTDPANKMKLGSCWSFYRNRFARIGPIYYLSNALAFPLAYMGFTPLPLLGTSFAPPLWCVLLNTVCFTNVWFVFVLGAGFCLPSWTVGTLVFFYLCFPHIFPHLQRCSDRELCMWIAILFYVQLSFVIITILVDMFVTNDAVKFLLGVWFVSAHPVSRLPVFLMGVLAGIQQTRINTTSEPEHDRNHQSWIRDIFPWGVYKNTNKYVADDTEDTEKEWTRRVDRNSLILTGLILLLTAVHGVTGWMRNNAAPSPGWMENSATSPGWIHNKPLENHTATTSSHASLVTEARYGVWFEEGWGGGNFYLQLLAVHMQVVIIKGLCRDGGQSLTARICNWPPIQELGRISMCLYLIHEVLIYWIRWVVHGSFAWVVPGPNGWLDLKAMGVGRSVYSMDQMPAWGGVGRSVYSSGQMPAWGGVARSVYSSGQMPAWGAPLVLVTAPILAWLLTLLVEEPLRKLLRTNKY